mmetsp:Transcript_30740/g.76492  ORF Transcript_30740/g.76492 Transcript_30740/m.76492 type:complete len:204 (-) Transcript_30740:230-841(-)
MLGLMLDPQNRSVEGAWTPYAVVLPGTRCPAPVSTRSHREGARLVASTSTVVPCCTLSVAGLTANTTLGCQGPVEPTVWPASVAADVAAAAAAAEATSAASNPARAASPMGVDCNIAAAAALAPMAVGHTRTSSTRPSKRVIIIVPAPAPASPVAAIMAGHAASRVTPAGVYRLLNTSGSAPSKPADVTISARPVARSCDSTK